MPAQNHKLIILAQSLEQPRIVKRIIEKSLDYNEIEVYGFKREIHAVNNYGVLEEHNNVSLNIVGAISNTRYLNRIFSYLKLLFLIYMNHGFSSKQIYVFGLDLRLLSVFIINSKIDYEISDILWLYNSGIKKTILRKIDLFQAKYSNSVTFTSKGFYNKYYKDCITPNKVIIKENKFKTYGKVLPIENIRKDCIRIAYIGAFRYEAIIENLLKVAVINSNIQLNFYGDSHDIHLIKKIKKYTEANNNIKFHGAFRNPDDLENIYAENNVNFVVYNNQSENEKVAMPNKYYESGYFNIPIVCAENTYVGERVLEQNMGWTIGIGFEEILDFFENLEINDLLKVHNQIKQIDKSLFIC